MIDVTSFQEYLRDNGYGQDKEEHKRHIWLSGEMGHKLNEIIEEHDGNVTTKELAAVIPAMPQRYAGWFDKTACKFFFELTDCLEADQHSLEVHQLIQQIKKYREILFQKRAAREVRAVREDMMPIPPDTIIDSKWLGKLTNEQFVKAYSDLQGVLFGAYLDIEQEAFSWGYPSAWSTEPSVRARLSDVVVSLGFAADYENGKLTVTHEHFKGMLKNRKKIPLVMAGLESLGFVFEGYSPKAEKFTVTFPDNPDVVWALKAWANRYALGCCSRCKKCNRETCPMNKTALWRGFLFSYRMLEAPTGQYSANFLAEADRFDEEGREIVL